ncbi:hypothetical protein EST38_g4615 [Candolleomyces aberdarensis]|uniref:Protein kinase domain-containing protein n=1 Tax=Candolleomyces aberdarensis TaxID=2316362 RepID=A0A4Q2DPF8_9AGAR|nr:hypothetical protein EST38_g4615 [Candolleomyces aberdarensis]
MQDAERSDDSPPRAPPIKYNAPMGTRWAKEKAAAGGPAAFDLPTDPKAIGPWILGECVGKGASGRVKIARHRRTRQLAAVKILPITPLVNSRASLATQQAKSEKQRLGIDREITMMKLMNHPNIMRIYDVYEGEKELYLVLEYVEGGELFDFLVNRGRLPPGEALLYFRQIIYGLNYAHTFSIIHRDLKPENILIASLDPPVIKIADWGMAAFAPPSLQLETSCGSPHYASPEIVNGEKYFGTATDIWSCGVILFALLTGRLPFDDKNVRTLLTKVKSGKYDVPAWIDPLAKDLLTRMLVVDVKKRITIPEIISHPWFNKPIQSCSSQPHLIIDNPVLPPSPSTLARPIPSPNLIDPELFNSLRVIWGRHAEAQSAVIQRDLCSPAGQGTYAKTFYFLLNKYREETMRSRHDDETHSSQPPPYHRAIGSESDIMDATGNSNNRLLEDGGGASGNRSSTSRSRHLSDGMYPRVLGVPNRPTGFTAGSAALLEVAASAMAASPVSQGVADGSGNAATASLALAPAGYPASPHPYASTRSPTSPTPSPTPVSFEHPMDVDYRHPVPLSPAMATMASPAINPGTAVTSQERAYNNADGVLAQVAAAGRSDTIMQSMMMVALGVGTTPGDAMIVGDTEPPVAPAANASGAGARHTPHHSMAVDKENMPTSDGWTHIDAASVAGAPQALGYNRNGRPSREMAPPLELMSPNHQRRNFLGSPIPQLTSPIIQNTPTSSRIMASPVVGEFRGWFSNLFNWKPGGGSVAQPSVFYSMEDGPRTRDLAFALFQSMGFVISRTLATPISIPTPIATSVATAAGMTSPGAAGAVAATATDSQASYDSNIHCVEVYQCRLDQFVSDPQTGGVLKPNRFKVEFCFVSTTGPTQALTPGPGTAGFPSPNLAPGVYSHSPAPDGSNPYYPVATPTTPHGNYLATPTPTTATGFNSYFRSPRHSLTMLGGGGGHRSASLSSATPMQTGWDAPPGCSCVITLAHEKGSTSTFKAVRERLKDVFDAQGMALSSCFSPIIPATPYPEASMVAARMG